MPNQSPLAPVYPAMPAEHLPPVQPEAYSDEVPFGDLVKEPVPVPSTPPAKGDGSDDDPAPKDDSSDDDSSDSETEG